jgi:dihydrofolate reductase|tara:strand:+ start:283 stop:786 length:504 start_codon:yes stop_codon:yes gene_type:complete
MIISSLVAMNKNRLIGVNNNLPWKLKDDLLHFRNYSLNKAIIMGRKTYESIGKPLPNRFNIVVSSRITDTPDITVTNNLSNAINKAIEYSEINKQNEIILIGGAKIFEEGMSYINKLVISWVDAPSVIGDVFFPDFDISCWNKDKSNHYQKSDINEFSFEVVEYTKK